MRIMKILLVLLLVSSRAFAEGETTVDMTPVYQYAQEFYGDSAVQEIYEGTLRGELQPWEKIIESLKILARAPAEKILQIASGMLPLVLLSALMGSMLTEGSESGSGVHFILRLSLILGFASLAKEAVAAVSQCLHAVRKFADVISPILTALLTAIGMEGSASLISPAVSIAGNIIVNTYTRYMLPGCRIALGLAVSGNLSPYIDLHGITRLLSKAVSWGAGILASCFAAFLALQGNIAESLDGVGVRTAKYAVDSASSVIGSGISDAWDSYVSGVLVTKNAVGVSGIAALLFSGLYPVLICLCAMAALSVLSAMLGIFGDKSAAKAAGDIAEICKMALSLCTSSLAIEMILIGMVMSIGKGLGG